MNPLVSVGVPTFPHLILVSFLFSVLLLFDLTHRQTSEPSTLFLLRQNLIIVTNRCDITLLEFKGQSDFCSESFSSLLQCF